MVRGADAVLDLSVDWVGYKLYWLHDSNIHVSELDGQYPTALLKGLRNPSSIALDPRQG